MVGSAVPSVELVADQRRARPRPGRAAARARPRPAHTSGTPARASGASGSAGDDARRRGGPAQAACSSTARPRRWSRRSTTSRSTPRASGPDLATVGEINDAAYGFPTPKFAPAIAGAPGHRPHLRRAGADGEIGAVAMAFDHGHEDTAVWFVATRPDAQRQGLGRQVMRRAAARGASSAATAPRRLQSSRRRPPPLRVARLRRRRRGPPLRGAARLTPLNPALAEARFCPRCGQHADDRLPAQPHLPALRLRRLLQPQAGRLRDPATTPHGRIILLRRGDRPGPRPVDLPGRLRRPRRVHRGGRAPGGARGARHRDQAHRPRRRLLAARTTRSS